MRVAKANPRALIGILSYNEGEHVRVVCRAILSQKAARDCTILLVDDSDDPLSREVVQECGRWGGVRVLAREGPRVGKVSGLNALATVFAEEDFDQLLHFDSDLIIEEGCVAALLDTLRAGYDLVTATSIALPGRNLFERALKVLQIPSEEFRKKGLSSDPLPGHTGAYSRQAVSVVYPIPQAGVNEEIWSLTRARQAGLRCLVASNAVVNHRLQGNVDEYVAYVRRVSATMKSSELVLGTRAALPSAWRILTRHSLVRAVASDPLAAACLPLVLLVRFAAKCSPPRSTVDTWDILKSTKQMPGNE